MVRFTLPRDLYHGKGALEALKTLKGKKAIICVGGGSMKRFGFLQRAEDYLKDYPLKTLYLQGVFFSGNESNGEIKEKSKNSIRARQDNVRGFLKPVAGLRCRHSHPAWLFPFQGGIA